MRRLALAVFLTVISSAPAFSQQVTTISLTTNAVVYDPASQRLFASVPSSAGVNGNSIAVINPTTGLVERYVTVGSEPNVLALSDDGQYLYVGLDGVPAVRRLSIGAAGVLTPGLQFSLGTNDRGQPLRVQDMVVLPGLPGSVAVLRESGDDYWDGVIVYDDEIARPTKVSGDYRIDHFASSPTGTRLYGLARDTGSATLIRMDLSPSGVSVVDSAQGFFKVFGKRSTLVGGLLYSSNGEIADPESNTLLGQVGRTTKDLVVDASAGRAYGLEFLRLTAFDLATLRPLWSRFLDVGGGDDIRLAGANRLAVRTSSALFVVAHSGTHTVAVRVAGTGNGVVSSSPTGITCGGRQRPFYSEQTSCASIFPEGTSVTLTATPYEGSRFVRWLEPECVDGRIEAWAPHVCTAVFEQEATSLVKRLPISVNQLAYSTATAKLYATIAGSDPVLGNSLVEIDPITGSVERTLWVGSEPDALAVTSDGLFAFVGLAGTASVKRIELHTLTAGPSFDLGFDSSNLHYLATHLVSPPGRSNSVAVVRQTPSNSGVAMFDDGVQRSLTVDGYFGALVFDPSGANGYADGSDAVVRLSVTDAGLTSRASLALRGMGGSGYIDAKVLIAGALIDAESMRPVGRIGSTDMTSAMTLDVAARSVYSVVDSLTPRLTSHSIDTLRQLWSLPLGYVDFPFSAPVLAGEGRLALRADRQVLLLDLSGGFELNLGMTGTGGGRLETYAETYGPSHSSDERYWVARGAEIGIYARPDASSRFVRWEGDSDCADGRVTMDAKRSCTAVFEQLVRGLGIVLPITANHMVFSPQTGKLYASIPAGVADIGNSIAVIDPLTGVVGPTVWVGSEPNRLSISDDGLVLYVGIDGANSVRRVNLAIDGSPVPAEQFYLGDNGSALELAVVPGRSNSVVVRFERRVALFENGIQAPLCLDGWISALAFSESSSRLLVHEGNMLVTAAVVSGGLTRSSQIPISCQAAPWRFAGGRLFTDMGDVLDGITGEHLGRFPLSINGRIEPDPTGGVVHFVGQVGSQAQIDRFDIGTFTQLDSILLPHDLLNQPFGAVVKAGTGRLAFLTSGRLAIYARGDLVTYGLDVTSLYPDAGVLITSSLPDAEGYQDGTTPFVRRYQLGTTVTLTAPATAGDRVFRYWSGRSVYSTDRTVSVRMDGPRGVTATYVFPTPIVSSVEPTSGPNTGGTTVTIRGTGFRAGATAYFGGVAATSTAVVSDSELVAVTPARTVGVVTVRISNPEGVSGSRQNAFTVYGGTVNFRRYFAEGAANWFFDSSFALMNPGQTAASVNLRFQRDDGQNVLHALVIPPQGRRTVDAKQVPGLTPAGGFSTVVESDVEVVADRTMTWMSDGYGSHSESSVPGTATTWYLAEGATHSGFQLYYLLQNPGDEPAPFTIEYLRGRGLSPITKTYDGNAAVPPRSRRTILVNAEDAGLASAEVSAVITSPSPIIVERAMYLDTKGKFFGAGHASAGVVTPSTDWFLAEGATGYFDEFILIANPTDQSANVEVTYLLTGGGTLTRTLTVAAKSRQNIFVNWEQGNGISLANTSVSARVRSTNNIPIIVERAMWWPSGGFTGTWLEAHNSVGATQTGTLWGLADGQQGGSPNWDTYILVANTSAFAGRVRVTLLFDDDTTASTELDLAANSRTTVFTGGNAVGPGVPFGGMANGKKFGALIESLPAAGGTAQIVVERAMYSDSGNTWWAAGTGTVGTRLR